MKRKIIFSFLISFMTLFGYSQISLGVEGGYNSATSEFGNLDFIDTESRNGYYFGAVPKIQFSNNLSITGAILFSEEGYKIENNDTEYRFRFFRLNPQLEYNFTGFLSISSGLSFGIKLSEAFRLSEADWETDEVLENIENSDIGIPISLKVHFSRLYLSLSYYQGLKDVQFLSYTDSNGNIIEGVNQKNKLFQMGIGYLLF